MANIKISELNELTEKALDDYVPIVDTSASETKKISIGNLVPTEIPNIENTYSESTSDAYSCDYVNNREVVLYDNSSGSNETITLSDDVSNYSYLEIYAKPNVDNYVPIVTKALITGATNYIYISFATVDSSGVIYQKARVVEATGTSISTYGNRYGQFYYNGASSFSATNDVYITRVIGYK